MIAMAIELGRFEKAAVCSLNTRVVSCWFVVFLCSSVLTCDV